MRLLYLVMSLGPSSPKFVAWEYHQDDRFRLLKHNKPSTCKVTLMTLGIPLTEASGQTFQCPEGKRWSWEQSELHLNHLVLSMLQSKGKPTLG